MNTKQSMKGKVSIAIVSECVGRVLLSVTVLLIGETATLAQGLPPPPPLDFDLNPETNSIPGLYSPYLNAPPLREIELQSPTPASQPPESQFPSRVPARLYRVEIPGSSGLLLTQVQRIEPNAFIRGTEGVIQAGLFSEEGNAQAFVSNLRTQGIQARVVAVGSDLGSDVATRLTRDPAYYVVIPGEKQDLPEIATKIQGLGVESAGISLREAPRGPHVAVGPFTERYEARRWNSYLRSRGINARIYFGR